MMNERPAPIDWDRIDTVLIDLDGTLLDLYFDNHFFHEHLPRHLAARRGVTIEQARADLQRRCRAVEGRLEWYCLDYWQEQLDLDLVEIKREIADLIQWRPHAPAFLDRLAGTGKRRVLATNAHPDSVGVKRSRVPFADRLDALYSAHEFGRPKEDPAFWTRLQAREGFDPARTLFVDDNPRVLASARDWGISELLGIRHPDSRRPPNPLTGFRSVADFHEVAPG